MSQPPTALVYPHQLWEHHPAVETAQRVLLIEDPLFFSQYNFHGQKLIHHRASMTEFAAYWTQQGKQVERIEAHQMQVSSDIGAILKKFKIHQVQAVEPTDVWLKERVTSGCQSAGIELSWLEDPAFLTPEQVMQDWAEERQHFHFTNFYMQQRKRLGMLLDEHGKPLGGKWTFDTENRKKLPKGMPIPEIQSPVEPASVHEARAYVAQRFPDALGDWRAFIYPVTYAASRSWLSDFVDARLGPFGNFEDAIAREHTFVFHSVLTPMLNVGLLTPRQVVSAALERSAEVPLNSLEGFVRQVIGWREFIRLVYLQAGSRQRTRNFWNLSQGLPASFYDGSTGILPVDHSIQRTLKYAYCHHIERLMVLGNFMLLCDTAPDAVYQWFMELFIDAYDWVMVPNVYGMSQHADGGLMTTKPYISGSAYILKMSDYPKGEWCGIWDALYWRFIHREQEFFSGNPRMRVMVGQLTRMGKKIDLHRQVADRFLERLHT
jgi:deoxyribodipyrimidine photolyase-related protein